jgi:hypothetical protein
LNKLSEKAATTQFIAYGEAQPAIVGYLLAAEEESKGEGKGELGRGDLLFLGLFIWESFRAAGHQPREVTPEDIEAAEEANTNYLERLEEGSEHGFAEAVRGLMETYNQMPLLGATLEILMSENAEEPDMAGEDVGLALLHLKTVIDVLDQ